MKHVTVSLLMIMVIAILSALAVLYLRLGFVIPLAWVVGSLIAIAATRSQWRLAGPQLVGITLVVLAYTGLTWLVLDLFTGQSTERTFSMVWEDLGSANEYGEAEVRLGYVNYPGYYVGEYSDELLEYLADRQENPVEVTLQYRQTLGRCLIGFHVEQIGDLTSWESKSGYSAGIGPSNPFIDAPAPGQSPTWCL